MFDTGRRVVGRLLVAWFLPGAGDGTRVCVVVSKRSFRRAVDRARAKRLLRESFRLNRFRLRGVFDVCLVARATMAGLKRPDVDADLVKVFQRAGVVAARE